MSGGNYWTTYEISLVEMLYSRFGPNEADIIHAAEVFKSSRGLRGISFGNFLIKQVAMELALEFPAIKQVLADPVSHKDTIASPLTRLGLAYLACVKQGDQPYDAVALFHLSNGARLERINAFANTSARGLKESAGLMVNYRYIPEDFESNHEAFVHRGQIALSKKLRKDIKGFKGLW